MLSSTSIQFASDTFSHFFSQGISVFSIIRIIEALLSATFDFKNYTVRLETAAFRGSDQNLLDTLKINASGRNTQRFAAVDLCVSSLYLRVAAAEISRLGCLARR